MGPSQQPVVAELRNLLAPKSAIHAHTRWARMSELDSGRRWARMSERELHMTSMHVLRVLY